MYKSMPVADKLKSVIEKSIYSSYKTQYGG